MEDTTPLGWQKSAKCRNAPPEYFYSDEQNKHFEGPNAYKRFCSICTVTQECLEFALVYGYPGVWGGLSERERRERYSNMAGWLRDDVIESGYFNNRLDYG